MQSLDQKYWILQPLSLLVTNITVQILHFPTWLCDLSVPSTHSVSFTQCSTSSAPYILPIPYLGWKARRFSELSPLDWRQCMSRCHCPGAESEWSEACFHQIKYELQQNPSFLKHINKSSFQTRLQGANISYGKLFHQSFKTKTPISSHTSLSRDKWRRNTNQTATSKVVTQRGEEEEWKAWENVTYWFSILKPH